MERGTRKEKIVRAFQVYDLDNNGTCSQNYLEFFIIFQQFYQNFSIIFYIFLKCFNFFSFFLSFGSQIGKIERCELMKIVTAMLTEMGKEDECETVVDRIFARVDKV